VDRKIEIDLDEVCGIGHCEQGDQCRVAVRRAYQELRQLGRPDQHAFEAAVTIYRYHHPHVPAHLAGEVVQDWVWDGVRH
jgi:hypothetical protein